MMLFPLKVDCQGKRKECYTFLLQGLGCCKVWFGSEKKERDFEGLWDAVYFIVNGCEAS